MPVGLEGNTPEFALNLGLADQLRRQGLEAEAEQRLRTAKGWHQVDVLVELGDFAIAIEAEFAPARTVLDDARKRLPDPPLVWRGLTVDLVFLLIYPQDLRHIAESMAESALDDCTSLEFALLDRRASADPELEAPTRAIGTNQTGSVRTLAEYLHNYWIRTAKGGSVEKTVELASWCIERAASILRRAPGPHPLAAADSDPEATSALIWLNALLFQELLANNLDTDTLPPEHRGKQIPRPARSGSPSELIRQWNEVLAINWVPIFEFAQEALQAAPPRLAKLALAGLVSSAAEIAERGAVRRHDVAGRIFHRLLEKRKFLATNYTTIPAAVLLAGLAFDGGHAWTKGKDWTQLRTYRKLRVVDPACGSGTLLMAALQELLKLRRRYGGAVNGRGETIRELLEQALHGYDVVPAAVHLTAATLSMAETRQFITDMPLFWMPHDVKDGRARMGSLDFLLTSPAKGAAQHLPFFSKKGQDPSRVTGTGESVFDTYMPRNCDVIIANPPFTRAGGPGTAGSTDWNPVFGAALSKADQATMTNTLRRTLTGTPASLYAGLGSAFLVLAQESIRIGGRLAFVLPATALTGSRWSPIREMLLEQFDIDWVIVSHDGRVRHKQENLPGRRWVAFSESTRIAETLIVATKKSQSGTSRPAVAKFVNLRRNPDEPIDAMAITRTLLSLSDQKDGKVQEEIDIGGTAWGDVLFVSTAGLSGKPWIHAAFCQSRLIREAIVLSKQGLWCPEQESLSIPTAALELAWTLGPYHMQVKNPKQGLFNAVSTDDPMRAGHPALWHHRSAKLTTLEASANARLSERSGTNADAQAAMLARASHLQIASELGHAPQRVAAVCTDEPMIGFSSWITLSPKKPRTGKQEALCLWLNSTPGMLLRILHANRPYLGRSRLPHEVARNLPVLDVDELSPDQCSAAKTVFESIKRKPLQGFAHLAEDPARRELDHRLFAEVLGYQVDDALDELAKALNREPTLTARH